LETIELLRMYCGLAFGSLSTTKLYHEARTKSEFGLRLHFLFPDGEIETERVRIEGKIQVFSIEQGRHPANSCEKS